MEREYHCFFDHCGQDLDWKRLSKAVVLLAHSPDGACQLQAPFNAYDVLEERGTRCT